MKKIISLMLLVFMLMLTGCGEDVTDQQIAMIDESDDSNDEIMYQLILDYGFESKETSYAEGDRVKVYYDIIATDTDYSFYTDSEDVELKRDYDEKKGYVISFIMPAHDVALHVNSVNSMEYSPYSFDDVPDEAWNGLMEYVYENNPLMGTIPYNIFMFDVTGDGHEDACASFFTGSGFVTEMVIIYDVEEKQGYKLSCRGEYDYSIDGIEDGVLLITRSDYNCEEEDVTGTVIIYNDVPVFIEDIDMLKMGLSYKTVCMFGYCAEELLPGNTASGDYLSSMEFYCVKEMLYKLSGLFYETEAYEEEVSYGPEYGTELVPTELRRMPYDEWEYLIEKVFMEEDAKNLQANLDPSFFGEMSVYYNSDDDCIYLEQGMIGDIMDWEISDVSKVGNRYILTYDVYGGDWLWTAAVTIEEADNTYGYRLISLEIIEEAEDVDWARPVTT